ncbi:hypothetical protein OOU_Y34scaffold01005g66 [Pyricularia oryzae Y34]|uniref:Uncharacterized protein n=1 Tax=Pyricularia oryzae (strain Y34) TaxID=1143189 RepID=A0AA97NMX4_PYRO3|nr:hypothetical protein OOU_Y34scaffold01005g66 [Pyricularia oryzae Y34]
MSSIQPFRAGQLGVSTSEFWAHELRAQKKRHLKRLIKADLASRNNPLTFLLKGTKCIARGKQNKKTGCQISQAVHAQNSDGPDNVYWLQKRPYRHSRRSQTQTRKSLFKSSHGKQWIQSRAKVSPRAMMATRYANAVTGKNVPPKHFGRGSILPRTIRDSGRLEFNPPETINKAYADTGTKKGTPLVFSHQGSAQDPTDGRFKKIMATQHLKSTTYMANDHPIPFE